MAIGAIKKDLEDKFQQEIKGLAVNELHKNKTECLSFDKANVQDYYEYFIEMCKDRHNISANGSASAAAESMLQELERKCNTAPGPISAIRNGDKLEIVYVITSQTPSYFRQIATKYNQNDANKNRIPAGKKIGDIKGFRTPNTGMRGKVSDAKNHGRLALGIEEDFAKLKTEEKGRLSGTMFGHHGGKDSPIITQGRRVHVPQEYTGKIGGAYLKETKFESENPITTKGMLKGREVVNKDLQPMSINQLFDETNSVVTDDMLARVIKTDLSKWFDAMLRFDNVPGTRTATGRQSGQIIQMTKTIFVDFALGSGPKGGDFTAAMKEWDAGKKNKLNETINKALDNTEIKIIEAVMKKQLKNNEAFNLIKMRGSPSVLDKVLVESPKTIIQSMFPHKTKPDMRFKVNKQLAKNASRLKLKKGRAELKKALSNGAVAVKGGKKVPKYQKKNKRVISNVEQKAGANPMALRNLINAALPQMVAAQMTSPRLRFRTGRLANSVRVDNITQGPRGGNTLIETSYATDPYGTYAPGGRKFTRDRDPERLVKQSVRAIATGIVGARFNIKVDR